ncbi:MAG: hypothetical protein Tsb0014_06110 [Pleurocapsa sp.]
MSQIKYEKLINNIRSLLGILELKESSQLYQDAIAISNYLETSTYQIAVFAPFNHGKSTLLNALLGKKTLPIDLIPTTGAAIYISYGDELRTKITFKNGQKIEQLGTKVLQEYAILDENRRMREDIANIQVYCHHPFLQTGVEFLDLPGTNDREAQNNLVKNKLLTADLIIHVLDARKLMTLEERNNLQNWLHQRGIATVIFVVNFLNLLTLEERQEIQKRLCFIAENFRSQLPPGISNLYCVDALPALRARLKGDAIAAQTTGLAALESALQNIIYYHQEHPEHRLSRVVNVAEQILQKGREKAQAIATEIDSQNKRDRQQVSVKQKAAKLIQEGFNRSVSDLQGWLYVPKLLTTYQASLAIALQQGEFDIWQQQEFKPTVLEYQQKINHWIERGYEFFNFTNPDYFLIPLPYAPEIKITPIINSSDNKNIPSKLDKLFQTKVGTVILGGASYILNKVTDDSNYPSPQSSFSPSVINSQAYADAAQTYLINFSDHAQQILQEYQTIAEKYITFTPLKFNYKPTDTDYKLHLLNNLLMTLENEIENNTIVVPINFRSL